MGDQGRGKPEHSAVRVSCALGVRPGGPSGECSPSEHLLCCFRGVYSGPSVATHLCLVVPNIAPGTCPHPTPRGSGCRVETWSSQLQRWHSYPEGGSQVHSKQGTAPRPSPQQSATCASGEQAPCRHAFPLDLQHITAPGPRGPLTHPNWGSEGPRAERAYSLGVRPHTLAGPQTDPSRTLVQTPPSLTPLVDVTAGQLVPFSPVVLPTKSVFVSVLVADLHLPTCTWLRPTAQLWHFPGSPALPGTEHWPLRSPAEVPGWMAEVVLELLLSPMGRD